ncbi:hypothetical protein [Bradyrhizobium sp. BR 1433]|uniref:hypothetical protein n=1 Tax=Bradyrhizobium sp. BR 1433 TaxID=3447967 RepID=UPI003EE47EBB
MRFSTRSGNGSLAMRSVPTSDWDLTNLNDVERRIHLLEEVSGDDLISGLTTAAKKAAGEGQADFEWQRAADTEAPPNTFRIVSQIPLPERFFDQLFNGRSGYRAQYYLSPQEGEAFNRRIIDALESELAHPASITLGVSRSLIARSFMGAYSKIWVANEREAFDAAPSGRLMPPQWRCCAGRGTRLPLASHLDIKGTFIQPDETEWVDPLKLGRAIDLHTRGYT